MQWKKNIYKRGAIASSLLSVIAKGIAFVQQLSIAFYCGANAGTDIHFYLFNLSLLIGGMIQAITSSILIPRSMGFRTNESHDSEMAYLNVFFYILIAFGGIVSLILGLKGDKIMYIITHFTHNEIQNNLSIYYLFIPTTLFMSINIFLTEIFVSYKKFTFPIFFNLGLNTAIIFFVIIFHKAIGASSMMAGASVLTFIYMVTLLLLMRRRLSWNFLIINIAALKQSSKPIVALLGNQCLVIFVSTFPFYLLSQFQPGAITIVNYAMKLIQAPYAFMQQIAVVLQIKLNELYTQGNIKELYKLTNKISNYVFVLGTGIASVIFFLRKPISGILFGLGNMSDSLVNQLICIIGITAFSLPFISAGQVWVKLYFAQYYIRLYVYTVMFLNVIACIIYYVFIHYYHTTGYAIAYIIAESLMAIGLWYRINIYKR